MEMTQKWKILVCIDRNNSKKVGMLIVFIRTRGCGLMLGEGVPHPGFFDVLIIFNRGRNKGEPRQEVQLGKSQGMLRRPQWSPSNAEKILFTYVVFIKNFVKKAMGRASPTCFSHCGQLGTMYHI